MSDVIRWGIVGCGDVTELKSGPGFQKATGSELVAVMRRNADLAEDYAKRHGVPAYYDDAQKLIDDADVDAVYVATPPSTHMEYALAAIRAGKPVYVEKPMAMSYAECETMVEAAALAEVPLFVAYYRRALPRFLKVNMLLHRGEIGRIQGVNIRFYETPKEKDVSGKKNWRVDPAIAGCGYFCDLGSHTIDLLQYLLGDIIEAKGFSSKQSQMYQTEDNVSAVFLFNDGILGSGHWRFDAAEKIDEVEIYGSEGKITFSTFANNPIVLIRGGNRKEYIIEHPSHIQQVLIQTIVDQLHKKGKCPSTGISAAKTNWVIDRVLGRI